MDDWLGPWISFLWFLFLCISAFSIRMIYKTFIKFRDTLTYRDNDDEYQFKGQSQIFKISFNHLLVDYSTGSSPEMMFSLWYFERGLHLWTRNSSGLLETRRQDNHQENENYLFRVFYSTAHRLGLFSSCRSICSNSHDSRPVSHGFLSQGSHWKLKKVWFIFGYRLYIIVYIQWNENDFAFYWSSTWHIHFDGNVRHLRNFQNFSLRSHAMEIFRKIIYSGRD